jgi:hypothetical protein
VPGVNAGASFDLFGGVLARENEGSLETDAILRDAAPARGSSG